MVKIYYLRKITSQSGSVSVRVKGEKKLKEYQNTGYKIEKEIEV